MPRFPRKATLPNGLRSEQTAMAGFAIWLSTSCVTSHVAQSELPLIHHMHGTTICISAAVIDAGVPATRLLMSLIASTMLLVAKPNYAGAITPNLLQQGDRPSQISAIEVPDQADARLRVVRASGYKIGRRPQHLLLSSSHPQTQLFLRSA